MTPPSTAQPNKGIQRTRNQLSCAPGNSTIKLLFAMEVEMEQEKHFRLEKNVAGPFYTTGDCLACDAPESEAPDLLEPLTDDNYDTYFVRQPETPEELERACRALEVCCVAALRYGGTEPSIIRRLGNDPLYCDHLLPGGPIPRPDWMAEQRKAVRNEQHRAWWKFWPRWTS